MMVDDSYTCVASFLARNKKKLEELTSTTRLTGREYQLKFPIVVSSQEASVERPARFVGVVGVVSWFWALISISFLHTYSRPITSSHFHQRSTRANTATPGRCGVAHFNCNLKSRLKRVCAVRFCSGIMFMVRHKSRPSWRN